MSVVTKIGSGVGAYMNYEKNSILIFIISTWKLYVGDDDTIYDAIIKTKFENDVIPSDMKSAGIHSLNCYSFRHLKPFSFLDKSTESILPFVVLALSYVTSIWTGICKCFTPSTPGLINLGKVF